MVRPRLSWEGKHVSMPCHLPPPCSASSAIRIRGCLNAPFAGSSSPLGLAHVAAPCRSRGPHAPIATSRAARWRPSQPVNRRARHGQRSHGLSLSVTTMHKMLDEMVVSTLIREHQGAAILVPAYFHISDCSAAHKMFEKIPIRA